MVRYNTTIIMPDYKRTEELFKAEGAHLFKKPPGQQDDERFYAHVTHPQTLSNSFFT